jgi:hypothetical protein
LNEGEYPPVSARDELFRANIPIRGGYMKKIAVALALVVVGLSLGGCFVGKGKAPVPAPIVTKG